MKILFVTRAGGVDYQSDAIFHGLVSLGHEVTDTRYMWYLSPIDDEGRRRQWGLGFSIAGKLPDRSGISRDPGEIRARVSDRYYDVVVFGDVWRGMEYFTEVTRCYPRNRIAFVDGEDHTAIDFMCRHRGTYFKRELVVDDPDLHPVSFALPAEQFCCDDAVSSKELDVAALVPGNRATYVYSTEADYYAAYRKSRFAFTWKKAGWDCFRHYEILAAGCLPLFTDFPYIPPRTMTTWPRHLQERANWVGFNWLAGHRNERDYSAVLAEFLAYGRAKLTTTHLAQYVLDTLLATK